MTRRRARPVRLPHRNRADPRRLPSESTGSGLTIEEGPPWRATAQETEQITQTLDRYVESVRDGDAAKMRDVFHPEARMWGSVLGERYDEPIDALFAMSDGKPADVDGSYKATVTSIEQHGDVATAVLAEEGVWGNVSVVDFFALARIDGAWKIVNKSFIHTGGELPAE